MANQTENDHKPQIPTAEEMLDRLYSVDVSQFDLQQTTDQLKGNMVWVSVLALPVSATLLVLLTFLGALIFDSFIISFVISASIIYFIGKLVDQHDGQYRVQARLTVIGRIMETEGDFGLLPHFKHFLPTRYRHLWQSLRKGKYMYIDQYIQAINLLQSRLDAEKFKTIWLVTYPSLNEQNSEETTEQNRFEIDLGQEQA